MVETKQGYTEKDIKHILSNYHWMIKEVKRINELLDDPDVNVTSKYGTEAGMPRAKGVGADALSNEVVRRSKKFERKKRLVDKIKFIQERMYLITSEREKVVLDCLLDGMSIGAISNHMGLSRKHIERLRESIVVKMSHMS